MSYSIDEIKKELVKKYGESDRLDRCLKKIQSIWSEEDGTQQEFETFCLKNYIAAQEKLDQLTDKFEQHMDTISGHSTEIQRKLSEKLHLDMGEVESVDLLFGEYSPTTHLVEDFFANKLAFVVLLNYPTYTLAEKNRYGREWDSKKWREVALAEQFAYRIPGEMIRKEYSEYSNAQAYISDYNIYMGNIVVEGKREIFPKNLKLISHWGLRDYLKAMYKDPESTFKQGIIEKILTRIVTQEIPQIVINNPDVEWDPFENKVFQNGKEIAWEREPDTRYSYLKSRFKTETELDPWYPDMQNAIKRNFDMSVRIEEERVRELFKTVLDSPIIKECAEYVEHKLGRKLRAFDMWYSGFRDASPLPEELLDKKLKAIYPDRQSFQKAIPEVLGKLGFTPETAKFLAERISVDPARGAGHAMGAGGRGYKSHLRVRFEKDQFTFNAFNVAMHELGHCVEQVFSLEKVDGTLIAGVPNTAFTEAFAFVFQGRDQQVLGLTENATEADHFRRLHSLWHCFELCGVALTCMDSWKFMYENPECTLQELKEFVITHAKEIWNHWYAPIFHEKDSVLLAVYSHMIDNGLYLPNYPIGELTRSQIESYIEDKNLAEAMEQLCTQGSLTPQVWLERGMGRDLTADFMLQAGERALNALRVTL